MLVRREGEHWREPEVGAYPSESELQKMIAESPSLLPGVAEPVAVAREFESGFGPIDVVGVDLSGQVIICECKTARNPELRRKVVGQVFAYAAGLWGCSWETFARRFERASGDPLVDRAQKLAREADEEWDEEIFRHQTARCLESGEFQLVLAVEAIPEELRETVRFLNLHSASHLKVLALELSYRREGDLEILVPRVWGEETARGSDRRGRGDRQTLVAGIRSNSVAAADAAEAVLDWAQSDPRLELRYTPRDGVIEAGGQTFLRIVRQRELEVPVHNFTDQEEPWDDPRINHLARELADIGVKLGGDRHRPKVQLDVLADDGRRQQFIALMNETLNNLTRSA